MIVYLNGKFLKDSKASISIDDHGFLVGDGVYETMRVYNGNVFLLGEHLKRLKNSANGIDLKPPVSFDAIGRAAEATVKANKHKEAVVRLTLTRGPGPQGFDPRVCPKPTLLITSRPFNGYPANLIRDGMTVALVSVHRNSPEAIPPTVKTTSGMNNILAKMEATRMKAHEAIMLSDDGTLAEGSICNVFLVMKGQLFTPVLDGRQLPGVTRALVCRLARDCGIRLSETKVSIRDLITADQVFLTSTLMEIMPVRRIVFPHRPPVTKLGLKGGITQQLIGCMRKITRP